METKQNGWVATVKKNTKHLAYWAAGWVATMAIATFGQKYLWEGNSALTIIFITVNTLVGVGMILMHRKHLNSLDEMQRKVIMDAMAVALGVGVVGGLSYAMLANAKIIGFEEEIAHLVMLIGVTYMIGVFIGTKKYR